MAETFYKDTTYTVSLLVQSIGLGKVAFAGHSAAVRVAGVQGAGVERAWLLEGPAKWGWVVLGIGVASSLEGEESDRVKAYVGVTDGDWYRFLAVRPALQEVNFWQPSGERQFRVLAVGEPFFFKSHYPQNQVVGGGLYSGFAQLPISEAWELFGEANGVATLEEMRQRVGRYRRQSIGPNDDPVIGCVFVRDTRFRFR